MRPSRKAVVGKVLVAGILCGHLGGCESASGGKAPSDADDTAAPDPRCDLADTYQIEITGMGALWYFDRAEDKVSLSPPNAYVHAATFLGAAGGTAGPASCAASLSVCEDSITVDLADIKRDLEHPDVQVALASASPPSFGSEPGGDSHGYRFRRSDGAGFDIGVVCLYTGCVPDGIKQLMVDIIYLDDQALKTASCTGVKRTIFSLAGWGG